MPAEAAIYNFCVGLNGTHAVSDQAFEAVVFALRHARGEWI